MGDVETRLAIPVLIAVMMSSSGLTQTRSSLDLTNPLGVSAQALAFAGSSSANEAGSDTPAASDTSQTSGEPQKHGLVSRSVKRTLRDQKELYLAPFQPSNIKWDLVVLAGTGGLMATDRRIERHLPGGNLSVYSNASNITIGSLAGGLALMWGYGIKTHNEHLKEMGTLELETLVNTFLMYAPMQVIAGRQRPGEGNGYGDFWRHHTMNTSFPAGHAMFTTAMATVLAHEYPNPWVKFLAYGAATTVIAARFLAHDHWASDEFLGPALGYFIGTHIFHAHCNPDFNETCHRPSLKLDQP